MTGSDDVAARRLLAVKRDLEIAEKLNSLQYSECLYQQQSPLFSVLPGELRNEIFAYCLAEQDGKREIKKEEFYYRPDYTHYRWIDTVLLRVCRRIFLETRMIPVQNVTFRDWMGSRDRRPAHRSLQSRLIKSNYFGKQRDLNSTFIMLARPKHLQFFAQMFALEQLNSVVPALNHVRGQGSSIVTITLRHTDWYWWEDDEPLAMDNVIFQHQKWPKCVQTFILELETRNGRRDMLHNVIKGITKWVIPVDGGEAPDTDDQYHVDGWFRNWLSIGDDDSMSSMAPDNDDLDGANESDLNSQIESDFEQYEDMNEDEDDSDEGDEDSSGLDPNEVHGYFPPLTNFEGPDDDADENAADYTSSFNSTTSSEDSVSQSPFDRSQLDDDESDKDNAASLVEQKGDADRFVLAPTSNQQISTWVGSANIKGQEFKHHRQAYNDTKHLEDHEMMYYVVKLFWQKISIADYKRKRREILARKQSEQS